MFSYVRLKYGSNATDTVTGVIIYPDDFSFSEAGVASMPFGARPQTQINLADWETLEAAGCIFLPATPGRGFTSNMPSIAEGDFGNVLFCWSATAGTASNAYTVYLKPASHTIMLNNSNGRQSAFVVRLVQDL